MQRRDEILAKKAKLAELRRQREEREKKSKELSNRDVTGELSAETAATPPNRSLDRKDLDSVIDGLLGDRRSSQAGTSSPSRRKSRPTSTADVTQAETDTATELSVKAPQAQTTSVATQSLSTVSAFVNYEFIPTRSPAPEVLSYSKAIQTSGFGSPNRGENANGEFHDSDSEDSPSFDRSPRKLKRRSRREREREEALRQNLRKEIEQELSAAQKPVSDDAATTKAKYPTRSLTNEELTAVTASDDFLDFVERSSKVIERALDQDYDVLADYSLDGVVGVDSDEDEVSGRAKGNKGRRIRQIAQFYDERWCKKRMISDIDFSPRILLWDTRSRSKMPSQKTPLTGAASGGHTHPIYSIAMVGTQNANNIVSCSTDGVVCSWTIDMLSQPQEFLTLTAPPPSKTEDLSPLCMAFPPADPTSFLVGTEEGTIYPCHRYDRAGAGAGTDVRLRFKGHTAPVTSLNFHPARGHIDFGDQFLSTGLDWSIKLWKSRPASSTSVAGSVATGAPGSNAEVVEPLLDIAREDIVYDAKWAPQKPGVFSAVDGAGNVEVWDLTVDTEVPVAQTCPEPNKQGQGAVAAKSLNKVAWEEKEGKRLATGGAAGVVSVFEVGSALSSEHVRMEEWTGLKRLTGRLARRAGR
ncbi:MAG: hypothetical protein Q9196_001847 [Gyalolechia fulgens]